jgi:hypothetical protein
MNAFSDYRRSLFAKRAYRLSWLLSLLPVVVIALYMITHPNKDSIIVLAFVLLLFYLASAIIVNVAAVIYWFGDRLPGGFSRLAAVMWPITFLASLWFFSSDRSIRNMLDFLLFDYTAPVVLATLGLMTLFIVVVRLSLWVIEGFKKEPTKADRGE